MESSLVTGSAARVLDQERERTMEPQEIEEFWEDLLAFIEQRRVIPVVGAELLSIQSGGAAIPLYRAVAEALLSKYGLAASTSNDGAKLRERHELNDAVCAVAEAPRRVKTRVNDLYRPVHDALQKALAGQEEILQPLRQLASIRDFDLFATTTPDNLLAQALNSVRFQGTVQTDEIEYAPKLPTDRRRDIPQMPTSKYTAVFYLFGKRTKLHGTIIVFLSAFEHPAPFQPAGQSAHGIGTPLALTLQELDGIIASTESMYKQAIWLAELRRSRVAVTKLDAVFRPRIDTAKAA